MKSRLFLISCLVIASVFFASPANASNFRVILPGAGWYQQASLNIDLCPIVCTKLGYCMIGGYGYETGLENSSINFKGDLAHIGNYYHIWIKGEGRATTLTNTFLVYYDIFIKIYLPRTEPSMNSYHCLVYDSTNPIKKLRTGQVIATFF